MNDYLYQALEITLFRDCLRQSLVIFRAFFVCQVSPQIKSAIFISYGWIIVNQFPEFCRK
jgi:hypothetical protein